MFEVSFFFFDFVILCSTSTIFCDDLLLRGLLKQIQVGV